jgi:hypothetical protein
MKSAEDPAPGFALGQAPRRKLLGRLEDIFVDIQRGSHLEIIIHQTSDVEWTSRAVSIETISSWPALSQC